ncbi:MAG: citrate/2-methylcitrate synthase [Anaerolineales bacterium]
MADIARGLQGVTLTETRLSGVDGEAGELIIGGYPLEVLAPNASYEETLHLLWNGWLPTEAELKVFKHGLAAQRDLPPITVQLLRQAADRQLPPMEALRMAVDTLGLVAVADGDGERAGAVSRAKSLVARFPLMIAGYWRLLDGQEPVEPDRDLGHAACFLQLLNGEPASAATVRGLETYLNAVVDHGMNASTFTARVIVSTRSDVVSAIVGAIGALKGPLHGGAPGPALDQVFMLRELSEQQGQPLDKIAGRWANEVIDRGDRIMGFGHRVYRVRDPRADVLGQAAEVLFSKQEDQSLYQDARTVEQAILQVLAERKPQRRLNTNVEFYTALLLHGIGLEPAIFSSVFALSRVGGWTAHVLEQLADNILIRPRSVYTGERQESWPPLDARG